MAEEGEVSWDLDVTTAVTTVSGLPTPLAVVEGNKVSSGGLGLFPGRCGSQL